LCNFSNVGPRFVPVTTTLFTVLSGAAGWVNTDVSSLTGAGTTKLWVIVVFNNAPIYQFTGARAHGSIIDNSFASLFTTTLMSYVDSSGHVDLYRDITAANDYRFVGYLQ
jgi:hypothetical protein